MSNYYGQENNYVPDLGQEDQTPLNQPRNQNNMYSPNLPMTNHPQPYIQNPYQQQSQYANFNLPDNKFSQDFIPHKVKIMMTEGVFIKQEVQYLEVVSGYETKNKYVLYRKKPGKVDKLGKPLWKAIEKSNWCSRNCCTNQCRSLKIRIQNITKFDEDPVCLLLEKPCTCTFLCCNRPVINVYYEEEKSGRQYIGKIYDNFDFWNFNFTIYDKNDKKIFRIHAGCCQCGTCCNSCPCKPCETVKFTIYDRKGKSICKLKKQNKNCIKSMVSDADNFGLDFTPQMDWEQRSLLMSAVFLIDFMMFEEKGGAVDNKQKN